ncbi:hypothetical protein [Nocardioides marmotae]|uniref:hypothetical protein n=1 Tax=Nocardioides marmotae TaxID=2663857 RepID=UPI0014955F65|nr:hypothetical protein [Nocardioides marmotae]QKE03199.1 hypothetical protein HPC71_20645 [Nocardioides marmotae]
MGAVVIGVAGLTSCASGGAAVRDADGGTRIQADFYASEHGVRVGIKVGYPESREVTDARLSTGEESVHASLYPLDGTDPDREPASVSLAPGDQVLIEGVLLVPCAGPGTTPVFEVVSESQGAERTDYFTPANLETYEQAVAEWCARPLTMNVTGATVTPDGDYELRVELSNPGPEPVTVTSAEVSSGSSTWQETTVTVPAGTIEPMVIRGHGPPECAATPPWESGHVRADGEIIRPASDGWC